MSPFPILKLLMLPFLVVAGYAIGGPWVWAVPVLCFVIDPVYLLFNQGNRKTQESTPTERKYPPFFFRLIERLFLCVLLGLTLWGIACSRNTESFQLAGLVISVGIINGMLGFTLAHEFIHRNDPLSRAAGQLLLLLNQYPHYGIEHLYGHHVYSCTPEDPHTARLHESFYHYFPRALWGTFVNSWKIERRRLAKKSQLIFSWQNRMLRYFLLQIIFILLVAFFAGSRGAGFLFGQAAVAVFLLHVTGYVQHYGLMRTLLPTGKFEKTAARHAWNTANGQGNHGLFQLDKHADHHMHPSHSFEELELHEDSPDLPADYASMIWLALCPPLWFHVVHKRIPTTVI